MNTSADANPKVREAMHAGIITCRPEATLRTVAGILAAHRIHAVVVVDDDVDAGWLVVSDRDVVKSHSRGELDQLTARKAASEPTLTIHEDADLRHAAELMAHYGTSHVIVIRPGGGRPTGILSSLDVASAVARV